MKKGIVLTTAALASSLFIISCNKEDNPIPEYTVPTSYNFDNVDYTEASGRVAQWAGFTAYLGKSTSRQLSQDTVNLLWNNTGSAFTAEIASNLSFTPAQLNGQGFNLASKTADAIVIKTFADSMVNVSQYYNSPAAPGVPGKIGSNRIFNYTGLEFNQAVAKGLMGAMVLNQIFTHLDKTVSDDNNTVTPGQGTAMQHDWDLAFGYLGIPKDYDTSKSYANTDPARPLALGGYLKERGQYIKAGGIVFDAFLKGRAAIGAKDYAVRDQAIATIKDILEKTLAAAAYAYVTLPQSSTDLAAKFHNISEGFGFIVALKYRPANSKLSAANYQILQGILQTDFYVLHADAANTKLKQAQSVLSTAYGTLQAY